MSSVFLLQRDQAVPPHAAVLLLQSIWIRPEQDPALGLLPESLSFSEAI